MKEGRINGPLSIKLSSSLLKIVSHVYTTDGSCQFRAIVQGMQLLQQGKTNVFAILLFSSFLWSR